MPSTCAFSSRGTLEMGVCDSCGPTEPTAAGGAGKWEEWLHSASRPFSWTSKPGAHLGTEKSKLMLLAQYREVGRHVDCYSGWKMVFLVSGETGLCLEDRSALSIKWRALVCSSVQPPTKKQVRDGATEAGKQLHHHGGRKRPPFAWWASHNWAEREMTGLVSDSQRGATSAPVTGGLLEQGFEGKAKSK